MKVLITGLCGFLGSHVCEFYARRRYSYKAMKLLLAKNMKSRSFDFMVESAHYISAEKLTISEVSITYQYSNSSLNVKVLKDCVTMCLKIFFTSH